MWKYNLIYISMFFTTFLRRSYSNDYKQKMIDAEIIPLITPTAPQHECEIYFSIEGQTSKIAPGEKLDSYYVRKQPEVVWPINYGTYYTLCMIGMTPNDLNLTDLNLSETTEKPVMQQWEQWLIINIPGLHLNEGNELAPYEPLPLPLENTTDSYIFLVYEQAERFEKFDQLFNNGSGCEDEYQSIELAKHFAQTQRNTDPWAGSFFVVSD